MKMNIALVSRSLIALLFVVAGLQKLMHFSDTTKSVASLDIPLAGLVTLIVIIIEIPVAVLFAWEYRTCIMGAILMAFVAIVTIMVHGHISVGMNLVMALKNVAIIGGILGLAAQCTCGKCPIGMCKNCKNGVCETHKK
jgi:putative oxidoreductase